MENKNALQIARGFFQNQDYAKAYEVCYDYLNSEDNERWETLSLEESEEITFLEIESLIKRIDLQDFYDRCDEAENEDEVDILLWHDKYDDLVDKLQDSIFDLTFSILIDDDPTGKIQYFVDKVTFMAKELFASKLDIVTNAIDCSSAESSKSSYNRFCSYFSGYCCLSQVILRIFINLEDVPEIPNADLEDVNFKEAIILREKFAFEKSKSISEEILEKATDFPYFCSLDVVVMFMLAIQLINNSISSNTSEILRLERLKLKVNLICDFLNAILVFEGQRVSLCMEEEQRENLYNDMLQSVNEIRKHENQYVQPSVNAEIFSSLPKKTNEELFSTTSAKNNTGGCYVATAVYGSYDCPQVWTLRRYRDYILAETSHGRTFIKIYYAISPTLVKWFGHTVWFKKMWQGKLDRMVAKLQANGVESTPYEDRKWK